MTVWTHAVLGVLYARLAKWTPYHYVTEVVSSSDSRVGVKTGLQCGRSVAIDGRRIVWASATQVITVTD